jgi:hypothetical protein
LPRNALAGDEVEFRRERAAAGVGFSIAQRPPVEGERNWLAGLWRAVSAGAGGLTPWREASDVFTYSLALAGVWTMVVPAIVAARQRGFAFVYDAEDEPSPGQLRLAASRFASEPNLDCLQARLTVRNTNESWLSALFAIEYAVLFDLINPGLCALDLPIALGGTSNHFRVESLMGAGGWDEWNVAEDADLGIRLARLGYRIASLDSDTPEEAPHELANWFGQRVRWQKGWIQTFIVHSRAPRAFVRELGPRRATAAAVLIAGSVMSALFWPVFALDTLKAIPLMPFYYILVSAAAWTAIADAIVRPHYWAKTARGRSRREAGAPGRGRVAPAGIAD